MNCKIIVAPSFERAFKKLAKKYKSLPSDLAVLVTQLEINPYLGDRLGTNTYKIRVAIKSKSKGKSGGGRVITFVDTQIEKSESTEEIEVSLLTIYDKSEIENLPDSVIDGLIKDNIQTEEE